MEHYISWHFGFINARRCIARAPRSQPYLPELPAKPRWALGSRGLGELCLSCRAGICDLVYGRCLQSSTVNKYWKPRPQVQQREPWASSRAAVRGADASRTWYRRRLEYALPQACFGAWLRGGSRQRDSQCMLVLQHVNTFHPKGQP